jgi:glycosyltransferase involved in cell wall biosynthesis
MSFSDGMKIAIVVQRYGLEIIGGAEYLARLIAEHLKNAHEIEVLTTCAKEYLEWKNEYRPGEEFIHGIRVIRFKNDNFRDLNHFHLIQGRVYYDHHTRDDEIKWIEEQGPYCPDLIDYIAENKDSYDVFIFFTYRYYQTHHGLPLVKDKSILVPFAENDPAIHLMTTKDLFQQAGAIVFSTPEEKKLILTSVDPGLDDKLTDTIGCGIEVPPCNTDGNAPEGGDYLIYIGRLEPAKGCTQLFDYYMKFVRDNEDAPDLILIGFKAMKIPEHPKIRFLGYVSEEKKISFLRGAKLLLMPSPYESLSIVTLEAMACGIPVLVNGECDVLMGHCLRSNAGLWYRNYGEFEECLRRLLQDTHLTGALRRNGVIYVNRFYKWDVVEEKFGRLIEGVVLQNQPG